MNREAGRVEDRDVAVRPTPLGCTDQHVADLRHVVASEDARCDGVRELAVV